MIRQTTHHLQIPKKIFKIRFSGSTNFRPRTDPQKLFLKDQYTGSANCAPLPDHQKAFSKFTGTTNSVPLLDCQKASMKFSLMQDKLQTTLGSPICIYLKYSLQDWLTTHHSHITKKLFSKFSYQVWQSLDQYQKTKKLFWILLCRYYTILLCRYDKLYIPHRSPKRFLKFSLQVQQV